MPAEIWQPVSVLSWTCPESNRGPAVIVDLSFYVCVRFTTGIEGAVKRLHHSTFWVRRDDLESNPRGGCTLRHLQFEVVGHLGVRSCS